MNIDLHQCGARGHIFQSLDLAAIVFDCQMLPIKPIYPFFIEPILCAGPIERRKSVENESTIVGYVEIKKTALRTKAE